jgi:hypothetical protein
LNFIHSTFLEAITLARLCKMELFLQVVFISACKNFAKNYHSWNWTVLTIVYPPHMYLEFLRLAKLFATNVAFGSCPIWITGAAVSAMHVEVIQAQEKLKAKKFGHFGKFPYTCSEIELL